MADKPNTEIDFDNMSDEDFLKLDESNYSGNVVEGETSLNNEGVESNVESHEDPDGETGTDPDSHSDSSESDDSGDGSNPDPNQSSEDGKEEEVDEDPEEGKQADPMAGEEKSTDDEDNEESKDEQSKSDTEEKGEKTPELNEDGSVKDPKKGKETPAKAGYYKIPEGMVTEEIDSAVEFFKKVNTPFKADGKDFTVRSPEDAIRLMQQGVNYSRRMQEIKPMKSLNRMLTDQGLNDPQKLNFLIDVSKGDKAAITQLLKSHNIDPMDLDTEKDSGYEARNYQGDPQDNEFRDALDMALTSPDGQALVSHIHKDWDKPSKAKLRENPAILGNLQELKASGVYDKVVAELEYQKSIGYLTNVPFLQAFDQVGEAMKNAGVFQEATQNPAQAGNSMAPLQSGQPQNQPVASGARKQQSASKKPAANPHLSSAPPSKQTGNTTPKTPDFDKLSDEEFLKIAPPE